jgi:hypothetical protein
MILIEILFESLIFLNPRVIARRNRHRLRFSAGEGSCCRGAWGKHSLSIVDPNFPFEQGKPLCMSILLYMSSILYHMLTNVLCTYV